MRVALVHDYLTELGGAERVLEALCEIFPHAPIYTLIYDEKATNDVFKNRRIHTSFLQNFPFAKTRHRNYAWLMPLAVEQFDLGKYDLVISDSASYAKGIVTKPHTKHISYCHTPIRYAWDDSHRYVKEFAAPFFLRHLIPFFLNYLRIWDKEAALRVDAFIANSSFVKDRIRKYYRVEAEVIHPPVNTEFFSKAIRNSGDSRLSDLDAVRGQNPPVENFAGDNHVFKNGIRPGGREEQKPSVLKVRGHHDPVDYGAGSGNVSKDARLPGMSTEALNPSGILRIDSEMRQIRKSGSYYLAVGRLVAYKRFDLAIRAFNELKMPLVVAGEGSELKRLKSIAGGTITFTGRLNDGALRDLYGGAKALIFPQEEDFGITAVEAMAAGCPVIAYRGGGALENIVEGKTGIFFDHERPSTLAKTVEQFSKMQFDPDAIRQHAEQFSKEVFKQKMQDLISKIVAGI